MIGFFKNPLLLKQLREEVRSRKIFFLVPVYIAILSIVALVSIGSSSGPSFNPISLAGAARITMFSFIITMTILLGLISMVLGASSFSTEREKATYELLELTPLSYTQLVLGKFLHAFIVTCLILISSLPVFTTLFFMGGFNLADLFLSFFYLILFFAIVILGSICISIATRRTILSIILSLGSAFVVSIFIAIASGVVFRKPEHLGFAFISPWLITWQQIFSPTSLKLLGLELPVWPFYFLIYFLIASLFVVWGRNSLDTRKLERNTKARWIGLLLLNAYTAIGFLCLRSFVPVTAKIIEDFFSIMLFVLLITLPFFALGTFTDKDKIRFQKRPLLESFHLRRLLRNDTATGPFFLLLLIAILSLTVQLTSGTTSHMTAVYSSFLALWVFPWLFIFIGLRLFDIRSRGVFVTYILGTICYTIVCVFRFAGKSAATIFEFYLDLPSILFFCGVGLIFFIFSYARTRTRTAKVLE